MKEAIDRFLPGVRSDPNGGFFIWHEWQQKSFDSTVMLPVAMKNDVLYVPGGSFYPTAGYSIDDDCSSFVPTIYRKNGMRLCFIASTPNNIWEGIRRLGQVMEQMG